MPGGLSVGVPGNVRLMAMAHRKWGKLPWADLFQPAIHLAEGGFEVNEVLHGRLERMAALWKEFPKAQALYWREGGPAPVGAIIKNSELASFRSEEHTSELQSLMRISSAVFCLKKKKTHNLHL